MAHDGRCPHMKLQSTILQIFALSSAGWTSADPSWACIAALVPVVVLCAVAGDEVVNKILKEAVQELALSLKAVVQRLGLCGEDGKNPFPLVMVGVVLEANQRWDIGRDIVDVLSMNYSGTLPIRLKPAVAAALLAWNKFMKECLSRSVQKMITLEFKCTAQGRIKRETNCLK